MLPRQFRLDRTEFDTVKRNGTLLSGRLMGVLIHKRQATSLRPELRPRGDKRQAGAKAGIIVSKKLSKKSTERNRLKRRLRAALVRVLPEISGVHVVVLPTRRAMGGTVGELEKEIKTLLHC